MRFLTYFILFLFLTACRCSTSSVNNVYPDAFYSNTDYTDALRLPIIKPYEAVNTSGRWIVNSQRANDYKTFGEIQRKRGDTLSVYANHSASDVKSLNVLLNKIIILSSKADNVIAQYTSSDTLYYLADTEKKLETFFFTKQELAHYLKINYALEQYLLFDIDRVHNNFIKTGKLPWIIRN